MTTSRDFLRSFGCPVYIGDLFDGVNHTEQTLDNPDVWDKLVKRNLTGTDIYFCPNELGAVKNEKGHLRHNANVRNFRAVFIEFDAKHTQAQPFALTPNYILKRRGKQTNYHVYWLIEHSTDVVKWRNVVTFLINYYKSDDAVKDPARLLRLPNFYHMKDVNNPDIYDVVEANTSTVYTLDSIAAAHGMPATWGSNKPNVPSVSALTAKQIDVQKYIAKYKAYLSALGDVTEDRNLTAFNMGLKAKRLGLSYEKSLEMGVAHYLEHFALFEDNNEFNIAFEKGYNKTTESVVGEETSFHAFRDAPNFQKPPALPPPLMETAEEAKAREAMPLIPAPADAKKRKRLVGNLDIPISRLITQAPMGEFPSNDTMCAAVVINCLKNPCNGALELVSTNGDLYVYRDTIWQLLADEELARIITFLSVEAAKNGEGKKPISSDKINGTIKQMKAFTYEASLAGKIGICEFNENGTVEEHFDIIPMANGLLHVPTNKLLPHSRKFFYTNTLPFNYNEKAKCHRWEEWLDGVFFGDNQQVLRMQEWFGLNLTRDTSFQKFAMLKGATRSGKGTTLKVLEHLVGEGNFCGAELFQLASDPTLLAMSQVQTCTMGDVHTIMGNDQNKILSKIKSIVGEDEQTINRKFQTAIQCRIPAKITMAANDAPQFFDESGAFASRILLFIYRKGTDASDIDTKLLDKLLVEDVGIFNWALEGLKRLRKNGRFTDSDIATQYMRSIKEDTQPTLMFLESCVEITTNQNDKVPVNKMYDVYKKWCFSADRRPMSSVSFANRLQSASGESIQRVRGRAGRYVGTVFSGCKIVEGADVGFTSNVVPMPPRIGT